MALERPLIFAALKRTILALDAETGEQVWKTQLPGRFGTYTSIIVDAGVLYAARHGKVHALDPGSGEILWTAEDKDLKHYPVMLVSSSGASSGHQHARNQQAVSQNAAMAATLGGAGAIS